MHQISMPFMKLIVNLLIIFSLMATLSYAVDGTPTFSHEPGFYINSFSLSISCPAEYPNVWITQNGSDPHPSNSAATLLQGTLQINDRVGDPNVISLIRLNMEQNNEYTWQPPQGEVKKAHAILAACFNNSGQMSGMGGGTYFVDPQGVNRYTLPIFSIISDPQGLFDFNQGIMVPGVHYENQIFTGNYFQRGHEWERKIHLEFFEPNGELGFGHFAGMRIQGNFSRAYQRKSVRLYSRGEYGVTRFNYAFFENQTQQRFNRLHLRNAGQDIFRGMMRDAIGHRIYRSVNIETQDYRPVIKFLNGEYWGIFNLRDRYDRFFFDLKYGIEEGQLDLLNIASRERPFIDEGDRVHYDGMMDFVKNNDLSIQENFDHVHTLIDVDNFIDQLVMGVYSSNTDWPHTNVRLYRSRNEFTPGAGAKDGRWRWLINDLDVGFWNYHLADHQTLNLLFEDGWKNDLFRALLNNESFKNDFINRFGDRIHTVFNPEFTTPIIEEAKATLAPEMEEHILRWHTPVSVESWEHSVNNFINYFIQRPEHIYQQIVSRFNLGATTNFTVDINIPNSGFVKLNTILLSPSFPGINQNPYPFNATYFPGIPVRLEAIAEAGYTFVGWQGHNSNDPVITVDPANLNTIVALFELSTFEADEMNPEPFDLSAGIFEFNFWSKDEPEGSFPPHMVFQQTAASDPILSSEMVEPYQIPISEYHPDDEPNIGFPYRLTRRTRITGLEENGISFINTGRGRDVGAAVIALNTLNVNDVYVNFTAGTVEPNLRIYGLRLQGRVGTITAFSDILDNNGNPIEYLRNETAGHTQDFFNVKLPQSLIGFPYVQIRWIYHHIGVASGARAEISLGNIQVSKEQFVSIEDYNAYEVPMQTTLFPNYPNPFNPTTIIRYALPNSSEVTLEVFNSIGQRIAVLVNGWHQAGIFEANFNASNLSSGLYIYRLTVPSEGVQLSRKMLLVK